MSSEAELRADWRALLVRYNTVACELDREMQHAHGLSMSDFEALDRLIDATCERARMQDLASEMYLSPSALSRTVARLEKAGLVERAMCQVDRRGVFVDVTERGRAVHAEAKMVQAAVLAEHLAPASASVG
ncbi:MarR family transcriptional regulator [Rhodococcus sp. NPDC058521]|uniref:MarR family transcriptional regulator n=1 Tax=Rhodococcus sp. NPDC058521 TaxID=3346536 RepID=UPI0036516902